MKTSLTLVSCFIWIQLFACCNKSSTAGNETDTSIADTMKMNITVGEKTFTATLYTNATTAAFTSRLPMTINMTELNGNEKYFDLPNNLPANASNPGTIQAGDLMLYGSNTLVLFYKSFPTSYRYTRLGKIDDTSGLAAALGAGKSTVAFSLVESPGDSTGRR